MSTAQNNRRRLADLLDAYTEGEWTTKDGRTLSVDQMDDRHVSNVLAHIERNNMIAHWQCDATEGDIY